MNMKLDHNLSYYWQWDVNQRIIFEGVESGVQVHFSHFDKYKNALVALTYEEDGVIYANVPNILLQSDHRIKVYIYLEEGDKSYTAKIWHIDVRKREKPEKYVYTETELYDIKYIVEEVLKDMDIEGGGGAESGVQGLSGEYALEDLENGTYYANEDVTITYLEYPENNEYNTANIPRGTLFVVTRGAYTDEYGENTAPEAITVMIYDSSIETTYEDGSYKHKFVLHRTIYPYVDMYGLQYREGAAICNVNEGNGGGGSGYSPTIYVTAIEGGHRLTITDINGTNSVDVMDGKDGANGKDGVAATHSWNGTVLTITSASGTSSANLKGDKVTRVTKVCKAFRVNEACKVSKASKVTRVTKESKVKKVTKVIRVIPVLPVPTERMVRMEQVLLSNL